MKNIVGKFEKVSYEEFKKAITKDVFNPLNYQCVPSAHMYRESDDIINILTDKDIRKIYDSIELPSRATSKSAGYDFYFPFFNSCVLGGLSTITIPTGIKCKIEDGWGLFLYPRSGHGFKYRIQLDNTVGIIDGDYYNNSDNEGHIFVKLTNDSKQMKQLVLKKEDAFCQGVFHMYGYAEGDEVTTERSGGFGSTSK